MAGFRNMMIAFLITGLFFVALASFSINFANENNANMTLLDDAELSRTFTNINETIDDASVDVQTQRNATEQSPTSEGSDNLIIPAVWSSIKIFGGMITSLGNDLLAALYAFGIPGVVLGIILAIIGVSLILWGWSVIRSGR